MADMVDAVVDIVRITTLMQPSGNIIAYGLFGHG